VILGLAMAFAIVACNQDNNPTDTTEPVGSWIDPGSLLG